MKGDGGERKGGSGNSKNGVKAGVCVRKGGREEMVVVLLFTDNLCVCCLIHREWEI